MPALDLPDFPFRHNLHDRLAERRGDDAFLAAAWADPSTRVVVIRGDRLPTRSDGGGLAFVRPDDAPMGERYLLGRDDESVVFLIRVDDVDDSADVPSAELRRLIDQLGESELSLAVHAVALARWHHRHPHCSVCGERTDVSDAGASRRCPACGSMHFPRTDPAVIMTVVDDEERCLLGHNAARAPEWYSTLAGFVEPGEAPEAAVVREVFEETGVRVSQVEYAGSQPWPFPASLMLGFVARADSTDITVDGTEITEARWFTRKELRSEIEAGRLVVPSTASISGALLTAWFGAPLPSPRNVT